jgi:hypothetical protein
MGTPISQLIPHNTVTTRVKSPGGTMSVLTPTLDTLASGAGTPPSYCHFPPEKKLPKKKALSESMDLSMFDILNTFHHHWFLLGDHLRAQALSAQKAKDGKKFWVEFSPQFHAHLVKCAVALVPCPLSKVKKVMFCYILELLNKEGPQAFFDLSKGQRHASQAQKEKKHLAQKRNHASRQECQKVAKEAVEGTPQWQYTSCRCKFTLCKTVKQYQCPLPNENSRSGGEGRYKGKTMDTPKPNKLAPKQKPPPAPSTTGLISQTTAFLQAVKKHPRATSTALEATASCPSTATYGQVLTSDQPFKNTSDHCLVCLNTAKKWKIRRGLVDTI